MPSCSPQVRPGAALSALTHTEALLPGGCFHGVCKNKPSSIPLKTSFWELWGRMAMWVPCVAQAHGVGSGCPGRRLLARGSW